MKRLQAGFTLIELMLVILIIGLLAAIAVPKFGQAIRNANESATKGKLGTLRSALSIYFADLEGSYPTDLTPLLQPGSKYISGIIPFLLSDHGSSSEINYYTAFDGTIDGAAWGYINADGDWGRTWVQCTHKDVRGRVWTSY